MLLDIDQWLKQMYIGKYEIREISSPSIKLKNGSYDPRGLFSTEVFGQVGSDQWRKAYGVIRLPHPVLHPAIYYIIQRRISSIYNWIHLEHGAIVNRDGTLSLTDNTSDYDLCGLIDLYDNTSDVDKVLTASKKLDTMTGKTIMSKLIKKDGPMFVSGVIVPPPIYRPNDEDNHFYVKIIEECTILRSALKSKDKLIKNRVIAAVQDLYHQLFESMINKVKGKTGLIRGSIIGRNADFSGRSVIVGDPKIRPDQIGVPKTMLVRLFYPWIIHYITTHQEVANELSKFTPVNKPALHNLINNKVMDEDIDERILEILYKVTEVVIKDKVVIAKRDPALHKLSDRAYYPVMVDDSSMHISPMVCAGHNADFDGDQMGIFVPLTASAQKQAKDKMLTTNNIYHPQSGLSLELSKDFVLGIYIITRDESPDTKPMIINNDASIFDVLYKADKYNILVKYKDRVNTLGRRVMEIVFDDKIRVESAINNKKLEGMFELFASDPKWLVEKMILVQNIGAFASTVFGGTMNIRDFTMPDDLKKRRNEVVNNPSKYDVSKELSNITQEFMERMSSKNQFPAMLVKSGARGSADNIQQMSVAKGYVSDVNGKILPSPISSNFAEGFKPTDYFISASGSRKGVVDRVMNTAKSGYLMRQLVYLLSTVKAGPSRFCGTQRFLELVLNDEIVGLLKGRVLEGGAILTKEYAEKHDLYGKVVKIYSPMYCKSRELCHYCYPERYRTVTNNVGNIGIISAQVLGERGSQLTMRTFHCFHGDMKVDVTFGSGPLQTLSFKELWNYVDSNIRVTPEGQEEKWINEASKNIQPIRVSDVSGGEKFTTVIKVIRHKKDPSTKMKRITLEDRTQIICQDNHPHMIFNKDLCLFEPKIITDEEFKPNKFQVLVGYYIKNIVSYDDYLEFDEEKDYVYDLQTSSHTLRVNDVWEHNTGGSSSIEFLNKDAPIVDEYIIQDGLDLTAKKALKIRILDPGFETANTFVSRNFIIIDGEKIHKCNVTVNVAFEGLQAEEVKYIDSDVMLTFDEGSRIGQIEATATDVTNAIVTIQSILNHASNYESGEQILFELYETYRVATKVPFIYLESVVSQLMRDPDKPVLPYRLGSMTKDPTFAGIKAVPALENPIRGMVFERVSDVLINSILTNQELKDRPQSDLEAIFRW